MNRGGEAPRAGFGSPAYGAYGAPGRRGHENDKAELSRFA